MNVGPQLGLLLGSDGRAYKAIEGGFATDLRLNYGLSDINDDPDERAFRKQLDIGGLHNRVVQLSVGYLFGKK